MDKIDHVDLVDAFREMTEDQLADFKFLSQFIGYRVGISLNVKSLDMDISSLYDMWGGMRCKQYPDELAKLLVYIYQNRSKINSYLEIGIEKAGTLFTIDSFLRAINDNYKGSMGIDIRKQCHPSYLELYKDKYPTCRLTIRPFNNIYEYVLPDRFDLCFIDAYHWYEDVKRDYNHYKDHVNIIAFHDIHLPMPDKSVSEFWQEIKTEDSIELLNEDGKFRTPVGIGILNP